jgi:hypothetical protein
MSMSLFSACTSPDKKNETNNLEGHWINKEYLDALANNHSPKKVAENFTFYATELLINHKKGDSIGVFNGQTEFSFLPFKRHGDTLRLKLNQAPQTEIIYSVSDQTLSFIDTELNRVFTFIKADSSLIDKSYSPAVAFPTAVNQSIFEGFWHLFEHNSTQKNVEFDKFGNLKGWEKYQNYLVCINGDCAANENGDVLFLGTKEKTEPFGFYSKGDTIALYQLKPITAANEKPIYRQSQLLALLVRKK